MPLQPRPSSKSDLMLREILALLRGLVDYNHLCGKHQWRGAGECPGCKGEEAESRAFESARVESTE